MAWPGGKDGSGVAQRLINEIPPHDVFVSAFLGDCAILRRKRPSKLSIGIDLDRKNIERWAQRAGTGTQFSAPLELYCCDGVEWLKHRFGLYRVPVRDAGSGVAVLRGPADRHSTAGRPCPQITRAPARNGATTAAVAANGDGRSTAGNGDLTSEVGAGRGAVFGDPARWFTYIDPPYLMETRSSPGRLYRHEMTEEQHADLLITLWELPCLVMVSHYPCWLYDEALASWRSFTFRAINRAGKPVVEKVWCNYPAPIELHDARYLGSNKREREKYVRRRRNLEVKIRRLPPHERQSLLEAVLSATGDEPWPSRRLPRPDPASQESAALAMVATFCGLGRAAATAG